MVRWGEEGGKSTYMFNKLTIFEQYFNQQQSLIYLKRKVPFLIIQFRPIAAQHVLTTNRKPTKQKHNHLAI